MKLGTTSVTAHTPPLSQSPFRVAFFSRGRGRGHAVPDMAVAEELVRLMPTLDIRFISYAEGVTAFESAGYDVHDLKLPSEPPFLEALVSETRVIDTLRPQLVVAHEEIPALLGAKVFEVPSIFITDYFLDPGTLYMQALRFATQVIFIGQAGVFTQPPYLAAKTRYVGHAIRKFTYGPEDRERARRELSLASGAVVVFCNPGSWPESMFPIARLVAESFDLLPQDTKHLIWLAGKDYERLLSLFQQRRDITLLAEAAQVDRIIVASDVVITKANRLSTLEAASLGVPTISLSFGANWPDDVAVSQLPSNVVLDASTVTPADVSHEILSSIIATASHKQDPGRWGGVTGTAELLLRQIRLLRGESLIESSIAGKERAVTAPAESLRR